MIVLISIIENLKQSFTACLVQHGNANMRREKQGLYSILNEVEMRATVESGKRSLSSSPHESSSGPWLPMICCEIMSLLERKTLLRRHPVCI